MTNELKDVDVRIEQLRFASQQFIKEKEREYDSIQEQTAVYSNKREQLVLELDKLKEAEDKKTREIKRLKNVLLQAEQRERVINFDIDCQIRSNKYDLPDTNNADAGLELG